MTPSTTKLGDDAGTRNEGHAGFLITTVSCEWAIDRGYCRRFVGNHLEGQGWLQNGENWGSSGLQRL